MKKFIFFTFLLISAVSFYQISFARIAGLMWEVTAASVSPKSALVGEKVTVSFDVEGIAIGYRDCIRPFVYFHDGTVERGVSCCAEPGGEVKTCHYEIPHIYNDPGDYYITIALGGVTQATLFVSVVPHPQLPSPPPGSNPLQATTISEIIQTVARFIYWIGTGILVIVVLVGGVTLLISAGNPYMIMRAKAVIFYSLLGFGIMSLARGIVQLIQIILGVRQ
jgi:hypothetical protein